MSSWQHSETGKYKSCTCTLKKKSNRNTFYPPDHSIDNLFSSLDWSESRALWCKLMGRMGLSTVDLNPWSGLNLIPLLQKIQVHFESQNGSFFRNKVFTDVIIKGIILDLECVLNPLISILIERRGECTEKGHVKMEIKMEDLQLQARNARGPEPGKGKKQFLSRAFVERMTCQTLISNLRPPELWGNKFLVSRPVMVLCRGSPRKWIQGRSASSHR